jgi:AMMECR1 domain-containing protein
MVAKKSLEVCFISGKDQLADILTKPLAATRFIMLRSNLNVRLPRSSLRGCIGLDSLSANDKTKVLELDQGSSSIDKL